MPNIHPSTTNQQPTGLAPPLSLPPDWRNLHVGIALSGGADSIALVRSIQMLKKQQGGAGRLVVFHVNHQLRDVESDEDARWCQQQCDSLDLPIEVLTCDTAAYANETKEGIEAAARSQRYQLLTDTAEQAGVRYLATAHTFDDQVETVLFRTLRGTGLRGLAGIPPTRALTPALTLIRPLLGCSRAMVIEYLDELGQEYRTDRSNTDRQFTRNRLRHDLLPQLREHYNQDLNNAVARLATQAAGAQQVIERIATGLLEQANLSVTSEQLSFNWQPFAELEPIVVCEALRLAWREGGLPEQAMSHAWWNQLAEMVCRPANAQVFNLPGNVRASIAGKRFLLAWQAFDSKTGC